MGQKDRHQGLFDVWGSIFRVSFLSLNRELKIYFHSCFPKIQRPKKQLTQGSGDEEAQVTMTDMSVSTRVRHTLDVVHSGGDYGR